MHWLARREYSREELRVRLRHRGADDDAIERALDDLAVAGYLSDARCAQAIVAHKAGRYGKRAIAHALKEKGIAAPEAQAALRALDDGDEFAEAQALWLQRFAVPPTDQRERARQIRFLLGRGYPLSVAMRVLRQAGDGDEDDAL